MKILVLKQKYDIFGPWQSFEYTQTTPQEILKYFQSKFNSFEVFLLFEADHIIVDVWKPYKETMNKLMSMANYEGCTLEELKIKMDKVIGKTYKVNDIPFEKYDFVWCRNPFIDVRPLRNKYPKVKFGYELLEDWIKVPQGIKNGYHYFIDHKNFRFKNIGNTLALPYPRCPDKLRKMFDVTKKQNFVYLDWRMIKKIPYYQQHLKSIQFDIQNCVTQDTLQTQLKLPFTLDPNANESAEYSRRLANSKYYVANIRRVGQSIVDAASFGCICFGTNKSPGHKSVCHPFCLISDDAQVIAKIKQIESNSKLQEEILSHQDRRLHEKYVSHPLKTLHSIICKN